VRGLIILHCYSSLLVYLNMLISIKRSLVGTDEERDMMINTRYILKIEPTFLAEYPKTRIIMLGFSRDDPLNFIYTNESLTSIKSKVSKARKTIQTED
jgi:hypothetical protein